MQTRLIGWHGLKRALGGHELAEEQVGAAIERPSRGYDRRRGQPDARACRRYHIGWVRHAHPVRLELAVELVPQRALNELFLVGTPAERRAHLQRYFDAGLDTAFMHFMTNETDPVKRKAIIRQAIKDMAP